MTKSKTLFIYLATLLQDVINYYNMYLAFGIPFKFKSVINALFGDLIHPQKCYLVILKNNFN